MYGKNRLIFIFYYVAKMKRHIVVVEYGNKSTVGICRILNHLMVQYMVVLPNEQPMFEPSHIILSGGPKHVYDVPPDSLPLWVLRAKCPVLGICYGMQLIAATLGGTVIRMSSYEKGPVDVTEFIAHEQITTTRWMNHHDIVIALPSTFYITGITPTNHIASFTDHIKWYAVQYHPEAENFIDLSLFQRFLDL